MKRYLFLAPALAALLAGGCLLFNGGCMLNLLRDRERQMALVEGRIGLEGATLLDIKAELPNEFKMDIGSDVGEWMVKRSVEASSSGASLIGDLFKYLFGWLKK